MKSVSLDESWSFKTKISGSAPQIYLGTVLFFVTIRELPFGNYRGRSITNLKARDEAKKQKTRKNKKVGSNTHGNDLAVTILLAVKSST